MKKILFIVLVMSFGLVNAQTNSGKTFPYVGLGMGQSISGYIGDFNLSSTQTKDDKDIAGKIFFGVSLDKNFAIEFEYAGLGDFSVEDTATSVKGTLEYKSVGISGIVKGMVASNVQLFARLGLHYWDVDANVSSSVTTFADGDNGTDVFGGVGANFHLGNNFFTRFEYERFRFRFDGDDENIDLFSASLIYKF